MNKRKTKRTRRQPQKVISTRMSGEMTGMPREMDHMLRLNTEQHPMKSMHKTRKKRRVKKRGR